jgi:hypothetical protein
VKPTADELAAAFDLIDEAFIDFPFSDAFDGNEDKPYKIGDPDPRTGYRQTNPERGEGSWWNVFGALLHSQMRHLMPGEGAPGYHVDKNNPGEGAGKLMNTLSLIVDGIAMSIRVYGGREEFEKGIPASLRSGDTLIGIDNISGSIESDALAAVHTAGVFKARAFRSNEREIIIPTRAQWIYAGSNFTFSDQLAQRMVPIRLDSGLQKPASRETAAKEWFRHVSDGQEEWLRHNRPRLVWALHTWISYWFSQGRPKGQERHPRFPGYSDTVGGALEAAAAALGIPCHFLKNMDAYKASQEDETDIAQEWLQRVHKAYSTNVVSAADMVRVITGGFGGADALEVPGLELDRDGKPAAGGKTVNRVIKETVCRRPVLIRAHGSDLKVKLVRTTSNPARYKLIAAT